MKQCSNCGHYSPLDGEPAAGWCEFTAHISLPFWMEKNRANVDRGSDVMATDGADCDSFIPNP